MSEGICEVCGSLNKPSASECVACGGRVLVDIISKKKKKEVPDGKESRKKEGSNA